MKRTVANRATHIALTLASAGLASALWVPCALAAEPAGDGTGTGTEQPGDPAEDLYFTLAESQMTIDSGGVLRTSDLIDMVERDEDSSVTMSRHFEYLVADPDLLKGTRHHGLKLAKETTEDLTTTVTIRYVEGTSASGVSNDPCADTTLLQEEQLQVTVAGQSSQAIEYGAQGTDLKLTALSPQVTASRLSGSTYRNVLEPQEAGTRLRLPLKHSAGMSQLLNNYQRWGYLNLPAAYRGVIGSKLTYIWPSGKIENGSTYGGNVGAADISSSGGTFLIPMGEKTGTAYVIISRDLCTYADDDRAEPSKYLGADLVFEIPVTESTYVDEPAKPLAGASATLAYTEAAYDSSEHQPMVMEITLADGSVVTTGFFVSYRNNVMPGTGIAVIQGDGMNLEGTLEVPFTITKAGQLVDAAKDTFSTSYGSRSFTLGAMTGGNGKLSYASSNTKVATVSSTGRVYVKGVGTAKITISAAETSTYAKGRKVVTVKVGKGIQKLSMSTAKKTAKRGGYTSTVSVTGAKTAKTYSKVSGSKYLTVTKTGKIKVSKAAKRGATYSVKLKAYAKSSTNYKAASKTATIKVKVK
ncbi:MAG: Ig-like domain-containing protein [Coriobacteriia bacterium]|nr:Ig-like domain-containing protein [Coriobacteriia bacterium]